jgi:hypothetical protein
MQHYNPKLVGLVLLLVAVVISACGGTVAAPSPTTEKPAIVELDAETGLNRLTLTEQAAKRLDIQTAPVRNQQVSGAQRMVIPYAALIYDLKGNTWAYTNPEPLVFMRHPITVETIVGDMVILTDGPAVGTEIAIVGVAELYGLDTGVGK